MNSAGEVAAYLIDRGLLRASQIVDGGIEITNASRRNRNYRVRVTGAPGFLLKVGSDPYKRATLAREARVYDCLKSLPQATPPRFLPRLVGFDAERSVLVLELVEADSMLDRHQRTGRVSRQAGAELGRSLATLHRATGSPRVRGRLQQELTARLPDAFVLHSPSLTFYRVYASQGNVKLLRTIRQSESLFRGLDSLRAKWRQECLVHGDPRWDNVLLSRRGDLTVVDWELSTLGDPCWDLGCVLVEHVNFWLGSVPITACTLPDDLVAKTRAPLVRVRASLAAFWQAYITARRWNARTARRALIKCVEFAGARLVQSAIEQTQGSTSLNALAVYQVQLAANLLLRPQAATELLGLATVESAWPLDTNLPSSGSEARSA